MTVDLVVKNAKLVTPRGIIEGGLIINEGVIVGITKDNRRQRETGPPRTHRRALPPYKSTRYPGVKLTGWCERGLHNLARHAS